MVRLTVEAELKDTFKNERWGHNLLLSLKVIWIVDNKCLSSFFLFNQRRHVFAQIRQRRRQRRRPTSILYLSLSLSANDHLMSCRLGLEEDQLESKTKQLIPSNCSLFLINPPIISWRLKEPALERPRPPTWPPPARPRWPQHTRCLDAANENFRSFEAKENIYFY